ncbi:hypothetical protein H6G27_10680 [Nostoc linckia FACHB-104]|nr:hypothetical protein [Nostoc linckia FACHB-104]
MSAISDDKPLRVYASPNSLIFRYPTLVGDSLIEIHLLVIQTICRWLSSA